ncbi:MAG TPA: hypothetical protein VN213_13615 [Solirubrobacteraceae bacterium]|nr:hypothetical protein [Solirubrobacteraceae bacterium]HYC76226.1 hypothetical protein [Planctomycetota bacterium]
MRLVALLCWFDEKPEFLADTVRSLAAAQVDALVALDGAYRLYPASQGRQTSPVEQWNALVDAAYDTRLQWTMAEGKPGGWESECEKRTELFRLAERHDPDWYLVIDADEVILQAPADLKDRLAATGKDYADFLSLEHTAPTLHAESEDGAPIILAQRYVKPRRGLIRAVPGIVVGPAHYDYFTPDGRNLWGGEYGDPLQVRDMVIDHRNRLRAPERMQAAIAYRDARDATGIERVPA